MKRKAYIGLSTPLFYDYKNMAPKTKADMTDSPNPILESPSGLIILYDELWFLTESLCPNNMRELPYVHFIDEECLLSNLTDIVDAQRINNKKNALTHSDAYINKKNGTAYFFSNYQNIIDSLKINWENRVIDNHTHTLNIDNCKLYGNSQDIKNLIIDIEICKKLGYEYELITNSYVNSIIEYEHNETLASKLTDVLVIERIPGIITPKGPYDVVYEEIRENNYLKEFRNWVVEKSKSVTLNEIMDVKKEVENSIKIEAEKALLRKYDEGRISYSIGKTICDSVIDQIIPGLSIFKSMAEGLNSYRETRDSRWQAFLISIKKTV